MRNLTIFSSVVVVLTSLCTWQVQAQECFQKSPNFTALGADYYNLENPAPVPQADQKEFIMLANRLDGRLTGTVRRQECLGTDKNFHLSYEDASVKARITASLAAGLNLDAEKNSLKTKTLKGEKLVFLGKMPSFQFSSDGSGHFIFAQKIRLGSGAGAHRLEEMLVDIQFNGSGVLLRVDHYTNGFYYATESWELAEARNNASGVVDQKAAEVDKTN